MGEKNLTAERENDFIMGCQKGNCATPGVNQKRSVRRRNGPSDSVPVSE